MSSHNEQQQRNKHGVEAPDASAETDIAVVGMACRFPDANDPQSLWANLAAKKISIKEVPKERWDWRAYWGDAKTEVNKTHSKWGSFIDDVDMFDAELFSISPREAEYMDPQQRVMLEVCWSCLEDAGTTPARLSTRNVGVYIAAFNYDYKELLEQEPRIILAHHATGCSPAIVANRISYYFDFSGPSLTVDTACSGSLYAIHQAMQAIRSGECSAALAGGINLLLTPTRHISFAKTGMLSPTGHCYSFDEKADGYVRGEGAGVIMLMPLDKAVEGGHRIYGVIKGSAVNHSGKVFTLTYPSSQAQSDVIYRAWTKSGLGADDVDYMEAHGTGTPKGDPIEWDGLNHAFERLSPHQPPGTRNPRRALGTVKANIGHLEAAAGIAGVIKVLLALEHKRLPGIGGFTRLNPRIDAENSAFHPLADTVAWPPQVDEDGKQKPRRAGVSSFGFGGTNAHVVIEEFIDHRKSESSAQTEARAPALIVLSAKHEDRLQAAARNLLGYLRRDPSGSADDLATIAYTLQTGRVAMKERLAMAVTSHGQLAETLQAFLNGERDIDILFRGRAKPDNGVARQSASDTEPARVTAEYVAQGRYAALLKRWADGLEVDWDLLYERGKPIPISLPTYSFARERYWIANRQPEAPQPPSTKPQETLLLQPGWQARNISDTDRAPRYAEHCVVLCDPGDEIAVTLASQLGDAGVTTLSSTSDSIEQRFQDCAAQLLQKVKELLQTPSKGWILLQVVVPPSADSAFCPALAGLLKSANQENPTFSWQLIETEAADAAGHSSALADMLRQNSRAPQDRHIRYQRGQRQTAEWLELEPDRGEIPWTHGGVYLITGGAGGLGLLFSRDILRQSRGAHLILVGRRPLQEVASRQLELLQREASSFPDASVRYRAVDVTDQTAVTGLIADIRDELGHLNGIVHGAGVIRDNFIRNKSVQELQTVLAPKVAGLVHLDRATQHLELDVFALFSSVSGSMGNVGQADYAAANAFQDCYAHHRNQQVADGRRHGHTVSINWPLWQDGGMKIAAAADTALRESDGLMPLQTEAGLDAFYRAVASRQPQVMVLAGDRGKLRRWLQESQVTPELEPSDLAEVAFETPELRRKVIDHLKQLLSDASRFPLHRIEGEEPLESYGIDSILIAQLNRELETVFTGLSKTLFFEYQTLDAVADHLIEAYPQSCVTWVGIDSQLQRRQPTAAPDLRPRLGAAAAALPPSAPARLAPAPRFEDARRDGEAAEPIAIIGISGRYPRTASVAGLWKSLAAGEDCIGEIPAKRWSLSDFFVADKRTAMAQGKSYSKWGGFVDGFADFDPLFFNISPREARDMDPQERLFLETCWATFEDAGYTKAELQERYQGRVGVFAGITKTGFDLHGPDMWRRGDVQNPQTSFSSVANRISYFLDLHGPSMAIDTMCSASMTAIHEACENIYRGECDMAISGGVNLYLHPSSYIRLSAQQMLSADGRCKSFGEGGDGFVPGEGVGAILLKPLSLAQRDGDHIYGLILGTSINHGGKTNGYTVPNPVAQARLVRRAMDKAGVNARQVSYIEAHGTGTKLGDPIEIRGLQQAFQEDTQDKQFCAIGSVKSNIGHLEAAAGIAGVTKVLLQMQHQKLAPSLHTQALNPNIDFAETPFVVQRELGEWRRPAVRHEGELREYPRIAGVSSFGAGGSNAHVILAEYDGTPSMAGGDHGSGDADISAPCAILLSARDSDQLRTMADNLAGYLREHRDILSHRLHDIAYTLQLGREAMDERLAIAATSYMQAEETLRRFASGEEHVADLYRGQVKSNKGLLSVFNGDEDMAPTFALWLAKRKYDKILALWVKGLNVDWRTLYEGKQPRRLSLPTYPFAGNTYWITVDQQRPSTQAHVQEWLHPLVQSNTSTFAGQEFTSLLSGQEFFLSEHRVHAQRVLPGVAYLEMARAASALSGLGPITGLRNVLWSTILSVDEAKKVTISLSKKRDRIKYQIKTAAGASEDIHGQGSVIAATAPPTQEPQALDIGQIEARCPLAIPDSEIYAYFHRLGLDYGAGFQALRQIQCSEHELLATYRLPASVAESLADFVLHPSIMDAALQALIGFEMRAMAGSTQPGNTHLPFSARAVDLLQQLPAEGYIYATRIDTAAGSELFAYDICVLDKHGASCVAMQQFTLRPLISAKQPPKLEGRREPARLDHLLFATPEWRERALGSAAGELSAPNTMVLLVDGAPENAEQLATRLATRVVVLAFDHRRPVDEAALDLVKRAFDAIKSVLFGDHSPNGAGSVRAIYIIASDDLDQRIRAPLASLLATVHQENTKVQGRLIAVPDGHRAAVDILCSIVQRESVSDDSHLEVAYRSDGKRLVKEWAEVLPETHAAAHAAGHTAGHAKDGGVYWITGGLGGLGKLFAQHLLNTPNVTIVLSGRSALTDENRRYIDTIMTPDRTIEYRRGDISDQAQVQDIVDYIQHRYGALDGIIHSAGVLRDGLIVGKSASVFDQVFAAKARGAEYIDRATRAMDLDFFVLCSSVAAVTGNPGQADYGSANAYLDAFAHMRNTMVLAGERRGVTVSINWPLWKEGGMRMDAQAEARFVRRTGISPLATRDGLAAWDAILATGRAGQVLLLSGDKDKIKATLSIGALAAGALAAGRDEQPAVEVTDAPPMQTAEIEDQLLDLCADLLQIDKQELDVDSELSDYGVDSIQMMHMLNRLESMYALTLDPSAIANHPTITQLARYLLEEGAGTPEGTHQATHEPTQEATHEAPQDGAQRGATEPGPIHAASFEVSDRRPPVARSQPVYAAPRAQSRKIAVIGQACRFPQSPDLETFWHNLAHGNDLITEIPRDRWDVDSVYSLDRSANGTSYSKHGGFLDDIAEFDAAYFGIDDAAAISMDPQHRIVLELARELMERSGYGREVIDGSRTSVLLGAKDNNYLRNYYGHFSPASLKHMVVNSIANMMAARVSDFYNLKGPAKTIDTACSSSLVAVHDACQSILAGEADMAIAGGIFLLVDPFYHIGFSRAEVLSDDGRTYVFDEKARGFALSEGAGLVLLKDYEAAVRDDDTILGVILGSAVNNDGRTMGLTVPNQKGQKEVIEQALQRSGVTPDRIGYLEAHGTGTLLGDPIEVKAATEVYRKHTAATQYCALGSVKSNMGHSLTAAGIASLAKVLLSLQHRQIPATINCSRPHPRFRFAESPFYPNTSLREWNPIGEQRIAAITSLGFGGTNCHMIVAEP